MRQYDVIVIGGGLAGLLAAAAARKSADKVLVLQKGVGAIAVGGGSIDVLGYGTDGRLLPGPQAGLAMLTAPEHPYSKIGACLVAEGLYFFSELTAKAGYPYGGSLSTRGWLVTALGTLKPSAFFPRSMDASALGTAPEIAVLGFNEMKDFYPELVVQGLKQRLGTNKKYRIIRIPSGLAAGRDVNSLDIARNLDHPANRQALALQLKRTLPAGTAIVLPPVLGTKPDYEALIQLEQETGCVFIEAAGLPPAVTGLRLQSLLINHLRDEGVEIMEQADVTGALVEDGVCRAVYTDNFDRRRTYGARAFVLATGGFYGGGLLAGIETVTEPIFHLPVRTAPRDEWGSESLLPEDGQPFAKTGIAVDASLRPVNAAGDIQLNNLYIAGRNLAGYDNCMEKSGNGVAVASGYYAGKLAGEVRA
jgi:glycerol-3-phosphate dehydrogenase subunit B